ncbi:hypothetical protein JMJ35_008165 [Cladonia borealis]|uniref:NAD-dependent epimerase/dehydratase domain-containing protein n=1 Tax=Cladonia borealis TaxID=184061 RepID=A0AA39U7U3_9LECA|nr:hypothetical protein JMJ35_008165 [Cladonia borealis]
MFCDNNVKGTLVILEAIRSYGKIRRFIHVSTDEVYGQTEGEVAGENHSQKPTNPYSASKAAAEICNNVYGPYQYPQKIMPRFIEHLMSGQKLQIQGHGEYSRRYLYSADAADAFGTVLHKGCTGSR